MTTTPVASKHFILLGFILAACGAPDPTEGQSSPESESLASVSEQLKALKDDLRQGSRGAQVRTVNAYLTRTGYFPNEQLAQHYPNWQPIVAEAPRRADVFDERTESAVRAFQGNSGLPVTGVVDVKTRTLMQKPRCGVPEGISHADSSQSFAQGTSKWPQTALRWRLINTNDVTYAQARQAAINALQRWSVETNLTFTEATFFGASDIDIRFGPLINGGALAEAAGPAQGGDVTLDPNVNWSVDLVTPPDFHDLESVLTHEIGHALGLDHSGFADAMMRYEYGPWQLSVDDKVAISSLYDTWRVLPGAALDIGASSGGDVWVIGTIPIGGNGDFSIHKLVGSSWPQSDGGAVRIAVGSSGTPYVVNSVGDVFARLSRDPNVANSWEHFQGIRAKDVAVGPDWPWVISDLPIGNNDFRIFKSNGGGWIEAGGGAVRIAVSADGIPWVVNSVGQLYRRTSSSPTEGEWQLLSSFITDVGVSEGNYAWAAGGIIQYTTFLWNEQPARGTAPEIPGRWLGFPVQAKAVSVGKGGRPWIVDVNGTILTQREPIF